MNKKNKFWLTVVVAIACMVLAASTFAGCKAAPQETSAPTTTVAATATSEITTTQTASTTTSLGAQDFAGKSLVVSGSTTLLEVSQAWAEAFMSKNGGEITINGGGSGVGITDLINGTNDLANSSRKIKDEEIQQAKDAGRDVKEYVVLFDGIAVILSKNIVIKEMTINQLSDIYLGKITNWNQVGGPNAEIVAVGRDSASGTGEYFLQRVVQLSQTVKENDYSDKVLRLQSNADVANQVASNDNSIGYIGLGYLASVSGKTNLVAVISEKGGAAILPEVKTVKDKSYPIARDLFVYADGNKISEITQAFIDFMLSDEGQKIGEETGFVSIR